MKMLILYVKKTSFISTGITFSKTFYCRSQIQNGEPNSPSTELNDRIKEWLAWDCRSSKSFATIENLVVEKNWPELEKLMLKRLKFGTAGIRGRMGYG